MGNIIFLNDIRINLIKSQSITFRKNDKLDIQFTEGLMIENLTHIFNKRTKLSYDDIHSIQTTRYPYNIIHQIIHNDKV